MARQTMPDVSFSFHEVIFEGKRVVLLEIPKAKNIPTSFDGIRYIRIGSSKVNVAKYPDYSKHMIKWCYIPRFCFIVVIVSFPVYHSEFC